MNLNLKNNALELLVSLSFAKPSRNIKEFGAKKYFLEFFFVSCSLINNYVLEWFLLICKEHTLSRSTNPLNRDHPYHAFEEKVGRCSILNFMIRSNCRESYN